MLTDCHSHLDRYPRPIVAGMIARAAAAGLGVVVTAGVDVASSRRGLRLAARYPLLRAGVGLHPIRVRGAEPDGVYTSLDALAAHPAVVVWSECGLDYREAAAPPADQRRAFRRQLGLARQHGLAAIVHAVDAADDALALLAAAGMAGRAAIHYFVGDQALAEGYLAAGLYLSVGKPVTRPANAALRAAIRATPLDRLLLETDTYPLPGRSTEPADVRLVAAAVAELHGASVDAVAAATVANLARLLGPRFAAPLA
ncbi:MAG TPA: TatD family hydrolase [Chloroflexota bacterium]|nr:TatD family hydrolase [Chloroflexota bacterium]